MKKRSGFQVMARLIRLVKPLTGFMLLAILMGLVGHLCAAFITIFGGYAVLEALHFDTPFTLTALFACVVAFAVVRGFLRYAEQACNHFIAFKLLALLRDRVFRALRRLCPAKLEGRDKGDLISVITSDIELLEVFYAHTISPAAIAFLFTIVMCLFIGYFHWLLGLIALAAYLIVGIVIPLGISELSVGDGMKFRRGSGELSGFVLDSLRGLSETLQYGQGRKRLVQMNEKTDALAKDEERMKRTAGRNSAVTNTVVLVFDLVMLFVSALLYQSGAVGFDGVLIPSPSLPPSARPSRWRRWEVPYRTPLRRAIGCWISWRKCLWWRKLPAGRRLLSPALRRSTSPLPTERKPSSLMCRWKFRNTAWSALWGAAAAVNPPY